MGHYPKERLGYKLEKIIEELTKELVEKNRGELDLISHDYFLFLKDGLYKMSINKETNELEVDIAIYDKGQAIVHHTDKLLSDYPLYPVK